MCLTEIVEILTNGYTLKSTVIISIRYKYIHIYIYAKPTNLSSNLLHVTIILKTLKKLINNP